MPVESAEVDGEGAPGQSEDGPEAEAEGQPAQQGPDSSLLMLKVVEARRTDHRRPPPPLPFSPVLPRFLLLSFGPYSAAAQIPAAEDSARRQRR